MTYYSLVIKATNTVTQVVDSPELRFDVHENYMWVEGPAVYDKEQDYEYDPSNNTIVIRNHGPMPWKPNRIRGYGDPYSQLEKLWDDMDAGRLPGKDTSEWYKHIKQTKVDIPKL
jgi:hypothetical protein